MQKRKRQSSPVPIPKTVSKPVIVCDNWKLSTFREMLAAEGIEIAGESPFTPDSTVISMQFDVPMPSKDLEKIVRRIEATAQQRRRGEQN